MAAEVRVGTVAIGNRLPLVIIAGPCVIEDEAHCLKIAVALKQICDRLGLGLIFKSSFDKANRSSAESFRGLGMEKGLAVLATIKKRLGIPITTDVHLPQHCPEVAKVADLLQIPAFLCRQTDLLAAAAETELPINLKKGQFVAPWDIAKSAAKIGHDKVLLTERGSSFGYNRLVADMCGIKVMQQGGYPVIFDASHSAQQPAAKGDSSGGDRRDAALLARAATAVGVAGLFIEVHDEPNKAPCDGDTMLELDSLPELLAHLKTIDKQTKAYLY